MHASARNTLFHPPPKPPFSQARVVVEQLLLCDTHLSTGEFVVLERELTADDVINEMNIDHASAAVERNEEEGKGDTE